MEQEMLIVSPWRTLATLWRYRMHTLWIFALYLLEYQAWKLPWIFFCIRKEPNSEIAGYVQLELWRVNDSCTYVLALLKCPFYYIIRSGFGNFFGMIHVLIRHLAPELDRFRFCPGFWSMLHFDRNLDIFGDVLTHGYNWAKMRNKRKIQHAKDGTERGQKGPRPAGLESLGRPA